MILLAIVNIVRYCNRDSIGIVQRFRRWARPQARDPNGLTRQEEHHAQDRDDRRRSIIFCKTLASDILATPALQGSEICLMSRTKPKLGRMEAFVKRMISENGLPAKVWSTLDRREALKGRRLRHRHDPGRRPGRLRARLRDPAEVRRRPVHRRLARARRRLPRPAHDPGAGRHRHATWTSSAPTRCCSTTPTRWPPAAWRWAGCPNVQFIGLCHGVQTTLDLISRLRRTCPRTRSTSSCAGINHMALVPVAQGQARRARTSTRSCAANCEKPEYYVNEKVRGEVMRHFGYFMTESTGHLPNTSPGSATSKRALETYCDQPDFGGASGAYYNYCQACSPSKYEDVDYLAQESREDHAARSVEYCSYILEAHGDRQAVPAQRQRPQRRLHHQPAAGLLRRGAGVTSIARGLHPLRVGDLPIAVAALNQSNVTVQTLAVEAALDRRPGTGHAGHRHGPADQRRAAR